MKNILVAADLSDQPSHAIARGLELAKSCDAHFSVIHTPGVNTFLFSLRRVPGHDTDKMTRKMLCEQMTAFRNIAGLPAKNTGNGSSLQLAQGMALSAIPRFAESTDADMIVIAHSRSSPMRRWVIGVTATHILRKGKAPLLIVKTPCQGAYQNLLIYVDFSSMTELTIRMAREIAPKADIVLLNVFGVPFEGMLRHAGVEEELIYHYRIKARERATRQICALANKAGLDSDDFSVVIEHGDAAEIILEQARYNASDLVVVGKCSTHITEYILPGSVTKKVVGDAVADVLVVVEKQRFILSKQQRPLEDSMGGLSDDVSLMTSR